MRASSQERPTPPQGRDEPALRLRRWLADGSPTGRVLILAGVPTRLETVAAGRLEPVAVFRAG